MYHVLLVDDENIILDGITKVVDWTKAGTELIGTARNGIEAFEHICKRQPDIVITDIRMPGMDGLQLIAKTAERFPQVRFIVLSGFGEFEYASKAMSYGVKHFLLKPCNEQTISDALSELVEECEQIVRKEQFVDQLKYGLERTLPHVKEQFLKEFVTNKTYGEKDWDYYRNMFGFHLDNKKIQLIVFQLEGLFEFEHLFAVKNIAEDILVNPLLSSTVGEHVLVVVEEELEQEKLQERIERIRETFLGYYKIDLTVALSEADYFPRARQLYKQTLECLHYRFYLGEGSLITKRDITLLDGPAAVTELPFDESSLLLQIKTGRWEAAEDSLRQYFQRIADARMDSNTTKTFVIQLFMSVIRLGDDAEFQANMNGLMNLYKLETIQSMEEFFLRIASQITDKHYQKNKNRHSAIVGKVIEIIHARLGDQQLSLQGVAEQMLYMNPDYLGKVFKKETGEKFSGYVMKLRINKAKELLSGSEDIKIFEIAEMLGFGESPQYFSQVFKKIVGCAPTEYNNRTAR
ncbi:MAG: DNA-binding response regulator [Paenibacillus sp.]|nr:DNA-binding response regulator [Paenibacillus sp.]